MIFDRKQLFPVAITFVAVGLLLGVALFLIFSNEPTVALILGIISGLTISLLLVFSVHRYLSFKKKNDDDERRYYITIGKAISELLRTNVDEHQAQNIGIKAESVAKGLAASFSLFGAIAIALSTALYYATILQARQLEDQNEIVITQNRLMCVQNNLAAKANRFVLFQLNEKRHKSSLESLESLANTIRDSLGAVKNCEVDGSASLDHPKSMCRDPEELFFHGVNNDYRLYGSTGFDEEEISKQAEESYLNWKEVYRELLQALNDDKSKNLNPLFSKYSEKLTILNNFTENEIYRLNEVIKTERHKIDDDIENCSIFEIVRSTTTQE